MIRYAVVILLMASSAFGQDAGTAAWTPVYEVFSHPRCANCHVGQDCGSGPYCQIRRQSKRADVVWIQLWGQAAVAWNEHLCRGKPHRHFYEKRCGPSRQRVRNASAAFKISGRQPKETFSTISARSRHSSELTDVGKSSTDHGRRVLACPPGHPANGGFTDTSTRTQSLNGLRAYRFVDEFRSDSARSFLACHRPFPGFRR